MAKLPSLLKARRIHVKSISQLCQVTKRFMAAPHTTLVGSPALKPPSRHPLMAAKCKIDHIFMAATENYTTLASPPDHLNHLPRQYPFMLANFNNKRASAKTATNWPRILFEGMSTSASDKIQNEPSSSANPSFSVDGDGKANPCLDLFFNIPQGSTLDDQKACRERMEQLLPLAWSHNPLTTLKLICDIFVECTFRKYYDTKMLRVVTFWLHQNHPKTLAFNLASIAPFVGFHGLFFKFLTLHLQVQKEGNQCVVAGQEARQQKQKAVERYELDPDYRFLHDLISDLFVECLKSDIENLKKYNNVEITEASDEFLSMDSNFIGPILLCESIARKVFPRESYPEYQGVEEADYTDCVLERLKNEVLLPLNKAREEYKWDPTRIAVEKYFEKVKAGKSEIEADALLPHEIITYSNHWNFAQVAELQWKAMVEGIKKQGKKAKLAELFSNCLAICHAYWLHDEETYETDASMALTILISELNEEPWKGKVIDFSESPQLQLVQGDELRHKCDFLMRRMDSECNPFDIDFEKVFDLILEEAANMNLKAEQMIKKVFVFKHDKHLNEASSKSWKASYETMQSKFKEKGYEVPQIVYWSSWELSSYYHKGLRVWTPCTEPGVTSLIVSSKLLELLFKNDREICLELFMEATIFYEEYEKLVVVD